MPSSWLLSVGTLLASSIFSPVVAGGSWPAQSYLLAEKWQGDSFLEHIEFFTGADPTNGYVTYQNQSSAESSGLFKVTSSGSMYLGVDHTNTLDPNGAGRDSVRVESKLFYKQGLYIVDIEHMPGSVCGTWPAFWSVGPRWPQDGEIDIVEGVNKNEYNEIVLHTSGSCGISADNDMTGTVSSTECGEASGTIGCVVKGKNGTSGTPFNEQGGGVYALERTSEFIKIWYFPRDSIPESITKGTPDTAHFGTPMAHLQGSCDFGEHFSAQKLIFNTDFCGDWAGGIFGQDGLCPMSDPSDTFKSCKSYVAQNPEKYKESYWEINSVQIY
ncbi:putative GPI anchored endo-1,3(4)-beta-glucanase, partial [Aspergillus glaucus CBS 516.65]